MNAESFGLRRVKKLDGSGMKSQFAPVAWSRLYDGSEQDPDACGYPHRQRAPERDPYYARRDTCGARGRRTQKCQEEQ